MKRRFIKDNRGSLTVEAALAVPIFVFSIVVFLFLFKVMLLQLQLQTGLIQAARELSQNAYITSCDKNKEDEYISESALGAYWEETSEKLQVYTYVKKYFAAENRFENILKRNISYQMSSINSEQHDIKLIARYNINISVPFFNLVDLPVQQLVKTKEFIGTSNLLICESKEGASEGEEDYVYVTENGIVYHRSLDCSHLKLSITQCKLSEVVNKRNTSGGKYKRCEKCSNTCQEASIVYICEDGDAYHINFECSGLKRTINRIKLSEVKDKMRGCHKCGT